MENKDEHKQVMKEKIAVLDDKLGYGTVGGKCTWFDAEGRVIKGS